MGGLLPVVAFAIVLLASAPAPAPSLEMGSMEFGMGVWSLDAQTAAAVTPEYGVFWVGVWSLDTDWRLERGHLRDMREAGVTPAVHLYYWGDDMGPRCLADGCGSALQDTQKDTDGWIRLTSQLTDVLQQEMGGAPAVVILESEFNKASVAQHEPLDEALAERARQLHDGYPAGRVVLGLGGWGLENWPTWDRAAAASDAVGIQVVRSTTRHAPDVYLGAADAAVESARAARELFGKPIFLHDVALASYLDEEEMQAEALDRLFDRLPLLKQEGVEAIIYRAWRDNPDMDVRNHCRQAERFWGLVDASGELKAAGHVWVERVQEERTGPSRSGAPQTAGLAQIPGPLESCGDPTEMGTP